MARRFVIGPEEMRRGAQLREAAVAKWASRPLISKEVRAMDCVADDSGMQGGARRFDSGRCKVRVDVPCFLPGYGRKRQCLEQVPRDFYVGTIFMDAKPRRIEFPEPRI